MPRWLATLFAAFCIACTGLTAPAVAERASQPGASSDTMQAAGVNAVADTSSACAEGASGIDADSPEPVSDLPDLISTTLPAVVPVVIVGTARYDHGALLPSPDIETPQRPPRSAAVIA